ncbi:MAG TPA: hypothetical protein VGG43_09445, partial [Acidimicrobiales bacterium]
PASCDAPQIWMLRQDRGDIRAQTPQAHNSYIYSNWVRGVVVTQFLEFLEISVTDPDFFGPVHAR